AAQMPDLLVRFSWELEFVDIDNDYDLDILVSCKQCEGGYLFENDGSGGFTDVSAGRLPQFGNNYDYEAMDVNGDEYLDLVTINDGSLLKEHLLLNNQQGAFEDMTDQLWTGYDNLGNCDDNMHVFLDFDSDGDADLLIGSLDCADRLLVNEGAGNLRIFQNGEMLSLTSGTLGIAAADLNSDHKLDVVMAQGENAFPEKVYFGDSIPSDTAPPIITMVEKIDPAAEGQPIQIRARIHDHKSPTMPHDWQSVVLRWTVDGQTEETPMQWYGEYLWRGTINELTSSEFTYEVCAVDAAGNEACSGP
ncbi:MAG: VCBS repeat-containing protein, partial [Chloroflexota bacterium]|nr:VCBS repeat-containing protein [Chloroflexota bacterium]